MERQTNTHGTYSRYQAGCRCDDCKAESAAFARTRYGKNREKMKARSKARADKRRAMLNEIKITAGCADCGYNTNPAALHFDHRPGTEKVAGISTMVSASTERLMAEIAKCDVRCANCHAEVTSERPFAGGRPEMYPQETPKLSYK